MLSAGDVKRLFELAKIEATEEELAKFPSEIGPVIEYVKKLDSADISGIDPVVSVSRRVNSFRDDAVGRCTGIAVEAFPESQDGYLKTKKILKHKQR